MAKRILPKYTKEGNTYTITGAGEFDEITSVQYNEQKGYISVDFSKDDKSIRGFFIPQKEPRNGWKSEDAKKNAYIYKANQITNLFLLINKNLEVNPSTDYKILHEEYMSQCFDKLPFKLNGFVKIIWRNPTTEKWLEPVVSFDTPFFSTKPLDSDKWFKFSENDKAKLVCTVQEQEQKPDKEEPELPF